MMEVKPIGVFSTWQMIKGQMKSNLCTGIRSNMEFIRNFIRYQPSLIKEIEHFFQVYKDLENKQVDVEGWGDETYAIIKECTTRFNEIQNKPEVI
jgi:inorganic pyrophosphatase